MPINKKESTFILDVDFKGLRGEKKRRAQEEIGDLLLEKVNQKLDSSNSPVKNGSFKKRKADGKPSKLLEEGDFRKAITVRPHPKGVKYGVFKDEAEVERLKAFNHNTGDTLPARQVVPTPKGDVKGDIRRSIDAIVNKILKEK